MGQLTAWPFDVPPDHVVVTTSYVTEKGLPILGVSHDYDRDEGGIWQFHCGNDDYRPVVLKLVRLQEILELDASIAELAGLPVGFTAVRSSPDASWVVTKAD